MQPVPHYWAVGLLGSVQPGAWKRDVVTGHQAMTTTGGSEPGEFSAVSEQGELLRSWGVDSGEMW